MTHALPIPTHFDWEGYRIPIAETERDANGLVAPPSPLPHPIPAHWDADYDVSDPLPWLWKRARISLENFTTAHGSPHDLFAQMILMRQPYRVARDWLFHIELLVRRILFFAACLYVGAFAPMKREFDPKRTPRPALTREQRIRVAGFCVPLFAPARRRLPDDWKAPLRTYVSRPRPLDAPPRRKRLPPMAWMTEGRRELRLHRIQQEPERRARRDWFDALPLAVRFCALVKLLDGPAPYIRRIARRLSRLNTVRQNRARRIRLAPFNVHARRLTLGALSIARAFVIADAHCYIAIWSFKPS